MAADSTSPSSSAGTRAFVRWTVRHGTVLWLLAVVAAIPAAVATARLYMRLNSDVEQLLPRQAASVKAIEELRRRMAGLQYLGVVVDAGDARDLPAAERFLEELAARVQKYPPELVRSVKIGAEEEKRFLETYAGLFAELPDLTTIRERIGERKRWELSKRMDILLDDSPPPPLEFDDIAAKYEGRAEAAQRFPRGRFSSEELHASLLLIEVGGFSTGIATARALFERLEGDIAALGFPGRYGAGMRVGFAGDLAVSMEEISALAEDLSLASLLVVAAVVAVLLVYFRWWRSVPILLLPLLLATTYAFAVVTLPPFRVRELNSNTAFLGSIIIGNGINFAIVLLARYVEARRRGTDVEAALVEAIGGARLGTLVAALAAAVSYASLFFTEFRGFRQFGLIGGVGMVICWVTSFVLVPSLVTWLDRGAATAPRQVSRRARLMGLFAERIARHPRAVALIGLAISAAAVVPALRYGGDFIESDFSRLRRRDTWTEGERFWGSKMDRILGRYLSPTVLLADTPEEARALATKLEEARKHPPLSQLVAEVRTWDTIVPPDQAEKITELKAIARLLSPATRAEVDPERLASIDRLLASVPDEPFTEAAVPASFTTGLRERDGGRARAVLVFPALNKGIWKSENLGAYVGGLRRLAAEVDPQTPARVAGALPLSLDLTTSIRRDGSLASVVAFSGVVVLVIMMFRWSRHTLLIVGSLVVGVLWLVGATFALGVKINFVNFIALPITFGIGVDYAVNVMARFIQDGGRDVVGPVRSTGAAVGLCSLTTIIGYSSLLLAQNQGLFLFGLVAVLGELACLVTALALLPATLLLLQRRRRTGLDPAEPARGE